MSGTYTLTATPGARANRSRTWPRKRLQGSRTRASARLKLSQTLKSGGRVQSGSSRHDSPRAVAGVERRMLTRNRVTMPPGATKGGGIMLSRAKAWHPASEGMAPSTDCEQSVAPVESERHHGEIPPLPFDSVAWATSLRVGRDDTARRVHPHPTLSRQGRGEKAARGAAGVEKRMLTRNRVSMPPGATKAGGSCLRKRRHGTQHGLRAIRGTRGKRAASRRDPSASVGVTTLQRRARRAAKGGRRRGAADTMRG